MSSGFDPCKQWLGIDALSLGDPWLVLGVARGETNPLAIVRAADARLTVLRSVPPGPLTLARDALVKRVEAARDELLTSAAQSGVVTPPAAAPAPRPMFSPPPVPMPPPVPSAPLPASLTTPTEPTTIRLSKRPVAQQTSGGHVAVAIASLLAVVMAAAVAYVILQGRKPKRDVAARKVTPAVDTKPVADQHPISKQRREEEPRRADPPVEMKTSSKPDAEKGEDGPGSAPRPASNSDTGAEPVPAPKSKPKPEAADPVDDPEMQSKPKPDEKPDEKPEPKPEPEPEPKPEPPPEKPQPPSIPEPAAAADPAAAATAVTKLLREAYAALREHEFDTADAALKTALDKAGDDDKLTKRVNCFRQLAQYAKQFLDYQDEAMAAAANGGIYDLPSGKTLGIVEINDKELVYKEGINKRIPRDKIPPAWIQAIITKWFSAADRAGNHVFLGVYHVLKDKPDLEEAGNEWRLAEFGGENVSFLTPLLRDPLLTPAAEDAN